MFRIYVKIDGADFDADEFQKEEGARLSGTVSSTKKMRNGSVEPGTKFWSSRTIRPDFENVEDELSKLLLGMEQALVRLAKSRSVRVVAEIVEETHADESVRGFFFSAETIQLLARLGVNLDIDIYS